MAAVLYGKGRPEQLCRELPSSRQVLTIPPHYAMPDIDVFVRGIQESLDELRRAAGIKARPKPKAKPKPALEKAEAKAGTSANGKAESPSLPES